MARGRAIAKEIILESGFKAKVYAYKDHLTLSIDVIALYNGFGELSKLSDFKNLFTELEKDGFNTSAGLMETGYYGSIDHLYLQCRKLKEARDFGKYLK